MFRALRGVRFKGSDVFPCGDDNGASGRGDPGGGSTLQVIIFSLESDELPFAHVSRARWWQEATCINCSRTCSSLVVSHLVTHVLHAWSHRTAPHRTVRSGWRRAQSLRGGPLLSSQRFDGTSLWAYSCQKTSKECMQPTHVPSCPHVSTVRRLSGANHTRGLI